MWRGDPYHALARPKKMLMAKTIKLSR